MSDSCDLLNCTLPGSSVHGISQARILEWVAISFSMGSSQHRDWSHLSCIVGRFFTIEPDSFPLEVPTCVISSVRLLSHIWLYDPMDCSMLGFPVHYQLLELTQTMSVKLGMPSTISSSVVPFSCLQSFQRSGSFPISRLLCIRWPKYWSFSFNISPSNEYSELISLWIDCFDLLAVQGIL